MPLADRQERLAHLLPVAEIRLDQPLAGETELRRHVGREFWLPVGGEPCELALVAQHLESSGNGRVAVGAREPRLTDLAGQPAVVAKMAVEPAAAQRAHRIADIVADAVGRIDQRLVPIGVEQRRERVRLVVIGEMDLRVRPERAVAQKALAVEDASRVGGAEPSR